MTQTTNERTEAAGRTGMAAGQMDRCIGACTDCHRVCLETARTCLAMGGKHAAPDHLQLLADCAQICQTSADFMIRHSSQHMVTCRACAEICRACERSCRQLGGDVMEACAETCARCADSCEQMSGRGGQH
jgi:hypothetical protein